MPGSRQVSHSLYVHEPSSWRALYTKTEDVRIIQFICKNKLYDRVKGTAIWQQLSNVVRKENYNRSWHSLKERFRKHIVPNLSDYNLDPEKVDKLLKPFSQEERERKQKKNRVNRQRKLYTTKEDKVIINHVLVQSGDVKGNSLWMKLEDMKIIPGRSWASMRNRFLKSIMINLDQLVDQETAEAVKRKANGDLSFVVYEKKKQRKLSVAKKENRQLPSHFSSPLHRSKRDLAALPCSERVASVSNTSSYSIERQGGGFPCQSDAGSSSSSNASIPLKKPRRKKLLVESSDNNDELANPISTNGMPTLNEHPPADSTANNPSADGALPTSLPTLLLQRCDAKISKEGVTTPSITQTGPEALDSKIFGATTEGAARECCCDQFDVTDKENPTLCNMIPCGSGCERLQVGPPVPFHVLTTTAMFRSHNRAANPTKSPDNSSLNQSEHKRDNPVSLTRRFPEWLCKPTVISDVVGCTAGSALSGGAKIKTEPEDREVEPMIIYIAETERMCVPPEDDEDRPFIDPIYAQHWDKNGPYVERNGCKLSLGSVPFPVVHPWS